MSGFQEYHSRPKTRRAYRVKANDRIFALGNNRFSIGVAGKDVVFTAHDTVFPGDYIIFIDADVIYHCRQTVFHDSYIVHD